MNDCRHLGVDTWASWISAPTSDGVYEISFSHYITQQGFNSFEDRASRFKRTNHHRETGPLHHPLWHRRTQSSLFLINVNPSLPLLACRICAHHPTLISPCPNTFLFVATMAKARISRKPSPYPAFAFHGIRAAQVLSSVIVTAILGYFVHHLEIGYYAVPWTFILVSLFCSFGWITGR